jgi:lauroyl/myristoyl acyltransferase
MSNLQKILYLPGYALYLACTALARLFPLRLVFFKGKMLGALGWLVLRRRRRLAVGNIMAALGKPEPEARRLAREHFMNLGANLLSALKIATMSDAQIRRRVTVELAPELVIPGDPRERRGWVAVLAHMGNWELLSHLSPLFPQYRFGAVYQKLANDLVDRHFKKGRSRSGVSLFDRREGYWKAIEFVQAGGALGVLADQYAGTPGTWMPFFRRLTSTTTLPAAMAQRAGVPIVPILIRTTGAARWKVSALPPIDSSDDADAVTARINRVFEKEIAAAPADWLWSHNRWKTPRWGFLLAASARRVYFPRDFDRTTLLPHRIVIRVPDDDGEAKLSAPAVKAVKMGRPDSEVTVVAPEAMAGFWKGAPGVDAVIAVAPGASALETGKKIRSAGRFDVALLFSSRRHAAWEMVFGGIPVRTGPPRRWLLNGWANPPGLSDPPLQGAARYRRIALAAGARMDLPAGDDPPCAPAALG